MTNTVGKVERIDEQRSACGQKYFIVGIQGDERGFWDVDGHVRKSGVQVGDSVKIGHDDEEFPVMDSLERLSSESGKKTDR